MTVKEVFNSIEYCWYFEFPELEFNGDSFRFTIIGEFLILGPGQNAKTIRKQLRKLSDGFKLITAMRVEVC